MSDNTVRYATMFLGLLVAFIGLALVYTVKPAFIGVTVIGVGFGINMATLISGLLLLWGKER
ncbi:MAG TPA: hypothetical protein VIY48_17430 [Candidatus Paceibacterota bacterium]